MFPRRNECRRATTAAPFPKDQTKAFRLLTAISRRLYAMSVASLPWGDKIGHQAKGAGNQHLHLVMKNEGGVHMPSLSDIA